mmetsp:Transcript_77238/g.154823  ORF Transcript_77238/g.154823 Transcript_77238/m.154823 type:complete len:191 (+) Transcript_77238:353-925(+)
MLAEANAPRKKSNRRLRRFLIEIKGVDTGAASLCARDIISSQCGADEVTIIGFSLQTMVEVKRRLPTFPISLVWHQQSENCALNAIEEAVTAGLDGIDLCADVTSVTENVVAFAKSRRLEVMVWVWAEGIPGSDVELTWSCLHCRGVGTFTTDCPPSMDEWLVAKKKSNAPLNEACGPAPLKPPSPQWLP